jgi:hypothetical protein
MMDYNKTRDDVTRRKAELLERQQTIKEENKKLNDEAEQNKRELIGLDQILDGLDFVSSDIPPDFEPTGFTDSIRKILSETHVPLVPTQIRDALQSRGITGSSAKNLLINVHKVLERIADELEESTTPDGKTEYRRKIPWMVPFPPPGIAAAIQGGIATDAAENNPLLDARQPAALARMRAERTAQWTREKLVIESAARRSGNRVRKDDD